MTKYGTYCFTFLLLFDVFYGEEYSSALDKTLTSSLFTFKQILNNSTTGWTKMNAIYRLNKKLGKTQPIIPRSQPFLCDTNKTKGARGGKPPKSVNEVHPGDIDVIAAIGDSLTAANGAISTKLVHLVNENRGISWSIGGRGVWRKYLTLPNILKEFNPNLYGYSTDDSLNVDRISRFNVAEPMALFGDLLHQTKILHKRMSKDVLVNMKNDWKLITIFAGSNDICSKICEMPYPKDYVQEHEHFVYDILRYLRKHFPRTIVNWVLIPNVVSLTATRNTPLQCYIARRVECRCVFSAFESPSKLRLYKSIVKQMQKTQINIINKDEFHSDTFTVNLQPFTYNWTLPFLANGNVDLRYFASDCFHFSQLGQAAAANALWNNMMQPVGKKQTNWAPLFKRFECPNNKSTYYIATRENSKWASL